MSDKNTGGMAFPSPQHLNQHGMTLRDYFAAKAMHAFINAAASGTAFGGHHQETNLRYASAAFQMADAMLKARES